MSQEDIFDIPLEQLELIARECERRKTIKKKSKLLAFDSVNHELEKYKQKMEKPEPTEPAETEEAKDRKKIQ